MERPQQGYLFIESQTPAITVPLSSQLSPADNPKLRILHVITALDTGGAEMMLLKLLSATRGEYCYEVVSAKDEGTIGLRIKDLGIPVHSLYLKSSLPNPFRAFTVRSLVRTFQPHVIQGWMPHGNLMASLAGAFALKQTPVLWNIRLSLHDLDLHWTTTCLIRLGARLSRCPAAIVYNSRNGAAQHEAIGYEPAKQVLIPNGFDCGVFHPDQEARNQVRTELGVRPDAVLVGLIARFHPMKDHTGFLRAASLVSSRCTNVYFLLAGTGVTREEPALNQAITEYDLQDRVFLLGERSDIPRLTAALDIACSSSFWGEAFSNAIGEAMACGVPCVVTDIGDSASIVADTGLVVRPRQPDELANAIGQLIESGSSRRQELGEAARQRVETEFSLAAVVRRYEALYRKHLSL